MQLPDEQHVAPVHPVPPHCPYKLEQLPLEAEVVVATEDTVLDLVVIVLVTIALLLVVPPPAVPVNFTVTTEYAGNDTVATPPDSVAEVVLTV